MTIYLRSAERAKLCALGCFTAVSLVSPVAQAGDIPPPLFNWAGLYIGASFGAAFPLHGGERLQAGSGFGSPIYDLFPKSDTRTGVMIGAQVGYNWQRGPWVWGFETDLSLLDGRRTPNGVFPTAPAYPGAPFFTMSANPNATYLFRQHSRAFRLCLRPRAVLSDRRRRGGRRAWAGEAFLRPSRRFHGGLVAIVARQICRRRRPGIRPRRRLVGARGISFSQPVAELSDFQRWKQQAILRAHPQREPYSALRPELPLRENERIRGALEYGAHRNPGRDCDEDAKVAEERYGVHAAFNGPKSFTSGGVRDVLTQNNLFLGLRLWEGGAAYLNAEVDEGYGPYNSLGAAAYPNGLAQKIGRAAPYLRFQRYFLRQIIGLDSDGARVSDPDEGSRSEVLESVQNQVSGKVDRDRIVLTVGKFAVDDVFDDNVYAHDPTTGFLNFAFNTMGAFDYAADAWGYSHGLAVEWKQNWWTLRAGTFQLSRVPNGNDIEPRLWGQYMGVVELEARYQLLGQPGAIKFLAFGDNGRFAKFRDVINLALATGNMPPDVTALQQRHFKPGGGINIKQQIVENLGFFMRASMSDGRYQTVDYTDVDRQLSVGLVADGASWGRQDDEVGVAGALSGLSGDHARYFQLGGLGTYIGDGALSYAGEKNMETYYKLGLGKNFDVTFDYQFFVNPAHNAARGPVNVFGLRARAAF